MNSILEPGNLEPETFYHFQGIEKAAIRACRIELLRVMSVSKLSQPSPQKFPIVSFCKSKGSQASHSRET